MLTNHPTPDTSPISRQGHTSSVGLAHPTLPDTSPVTPHSRVQVSTPRNPALLASPDTSPHAPDELLEQTPGVHHTTCPECDGQAFIEIKGSIWCSPHLAILRPALNTVLRPCRRCHGAGQVLNYDPDLEASRRDLEQHRESCERVTE